MCVIYNIMCDRGRKLRKGKGGDADKVHTIRITIVVTTFTKTYKSVYDTPKHSLQAQQKR